MAVQGNSLMWTMHPGFYLKEEMEERGLLQRDLAFILGIPEQSLNTILSGKRGISPNMAKALGEAFDVPAEFFLNLQQAYDLAQAENPDPGIAVRAKMQNSYPVREMIKRGWIEQSDPEMLELQLARFFHAKKIAEVPYMEHVAKKSHYEEKEIPPAQLAWLFRVRQIAESISVPKYSERSLRKAVDDLETLLIAPEEARSVPKILMDCGVKYILVERLLHADIDGVCFWDGNCPVIGMSLKRDKIDNFWFVLRHEIEHVLQGHGRDIEMIDRDAELGEDDDNQGAGSLSDEERIANTAAQNFCAPSAKLDSFMIRKHPFYYEKDVLAFSQSHNRHPGLIIGQMQRRMKRYDYLARYLVRIRHFVIPGAITDGWGQAVPVNL